VRASILLTSYRDLAEEPKLSADPLLASATLDWATHRARFREITGPSFRTEQARNHLTAERPNRAGH
jgi:hypothetical protein